MGRYIYWFASTLLLFGLPAGNADAQLFKKRKNIPSQGSVTDAVTPVVSSYDKLILNAKGRVTEAGVITLHKIGEKLYLELADDKFGREFLLSSYLDRTGDLSMAEPGSQAMTPARYTFEKTDSLVLLRKPTYNIRVTDSDANIGRAVEMSRAGATVMAFPIETMNIDSTGVVFEVTELLTATNRDLLDMTGKMLSGDFRVTSSRPETKFAFIESIGATGSGVSVSSETGLKLEATGYMGMITLDMDATVAFTAYLTLLPEGRMAAREADNRIGTGYVPYTGYAADGAAKPGYLAKRVNLVPSGEPDPGGLYSPVRPIEIYVDTIFSPSWYSAIKDAFESWSPAFREAGFADPVRVIPYPSDDRFNANDPTLKTVRFGQGTGTAITYRTLDDPRTGEIIGFTVDVPRDYVQGLRRSAVYTISETDARYREYFLLEDAVFEGLRANMIRCAGFCFGLSANYAGSRAYSPEQLRDVRFTQEKGFTASVMDGVMFNQIARPGDREKGVETVVANPGTYDRFAIKWLYTPLEWAARETLDRWLREVEGNPEYLYVRPQGTRFTFDPRAYPKDLGDDVFTWADNLLETVKFVTANGDRWIDDDRIPADYKTLFPDFAVLKFDDVLLGLCNYVGGIYINETVESSGKPYYRPVPKEIQRRALLKVLSLFDDLSWLDTNPRMLNLAGIDKLPSRYVVNNWPVRYLMLRITGRSGAMPLSVANSEDPYTEEQALEDIADYIFQDVRLGREISELRFPMVRNYLEQLVAAAPLLQSNFDSNKSANGFSFELQSAGDADGEFLPGLTLGTITSIDYYSRPDNSPLYTAKLREARQILTAGLQYCRTQYARDKYSYYIAMIDMALTVPDRK